MDSMNLLEKTRYMVRNRPVHVTYPQIASSTEVGAPWIYKFMAEKMRNPSIVKVQAIHDYMIKYFPTLSV